MASAWHTEEEHERARLAVDHAAGLAVTADDKWRVARVRAEH